jgi:hypothetical protein
MGRCEWGKLLTSIQKGFVKEEGRVGAKPKNDDIRKKSDM